MRDKVDYEWCIEYVDSNEDIQDHYHGECLSEVMKQNETITVQGEECKPRLVLIRNEGNDFDGLNDRFWCYPVDGELPLNFCDAFGRETKIKVPQKLLKEFNKARDNK
ncbi:MAG: hypothetical protein GY804_03880 [Alphaproteobacteria bacterium]|nr:hypothetical protein [Alphaproteobacteria bacterium]